MCFDNYIWVAKLSLTFKFMAYGGGVKWILQQKIDFEKEVNNEHVGYRTHTAFLPTDGRILERAPVWNQTTLISASVWWGWQYVHSSECRMIARPWQPLRFKLSESSITYHTIPVHQRSRWNGIYKCSLKMSLMKMFIIIFFECTNQHVAILFKEKP